MQAGVTRKLQFTRPRLEHKINGLVNVKYMSFGDLTGKSDHKVQRDQHETFHIVRLAVPAEVLVSHRGRTEISGLLDEEVHKEDGHEEHNGLWVGRQRRRMWFTRRRDAPRSRRRTT